MSFLSRAIMQYSCSEMVSPLLRRACTSRTAFQFVHRSEKPCLVRAHVSLKKSPMAFFWVSKNSPAANASGS